MSGHDDRKKAVLEEVGLHTVLAITDPAKLCQLVADDAEAKGRSEEADDLRAKSEQLEERCVN
jgi:hypothetical protein